MDHLTRPARAPLALALALALAAPAIAAPVAADVPPRGAERFPHQQHLDFLSLFGERRCAACHDTVAVAPPGGVRRETCRACHEPEPPAWLRPSPLPPLPELPPGSRLPVRFPHARHAASARLACGDCHRPTGEARGREFTADGDCARCHARLDLGGRTCSSCHDRDAARWRPPDHDAGWLRSHAADARFGQRPHGGECRSCHGPDACIRCHREREPPDHTTLFKVRLHGVSAAWDRERCTACHQSGVCASCHATTRPRNHTASWRALHMLAAGAVDNASCAACHRPSFCTACHVRGP